MGNYLHCPYIERMARRKFVLELYAMLHTFLLFAMMQAAPAAPLTAPEIVERMVRADNERLTALAGYSGVRHYQFTNKKSGKQAELTIRMTCDHAGVKTFEVISESGSGFVRSHIIRKMIEAEREASQKGERQQTRIIPDNYDFQLIGKEDLDGRSNYVLEVSPKTRNKFLIRGRIWVDAEDFAVARVVGQPAKSPSMWIRSVKIVQQYARNGQFWLPAINQSIAQARIFGATELVIQYSDYVTSVRQAQGRRATAQAGAE
jgi:hypothetical protein